MKTFCALLSGLAIASFCWVQTPPSAETLPKFGAGDPRQDADPAARPRSVDPRPRRATRGGGDPRRGRHLPAPLRVVPSRSGLSVRDGLQGDAATLYRLFQGPIATTLENKREPFLGVDPVVPGKNVYPRDVTREEIEAFLAANPGARAEILDVRTVVRRADAAVDRGGSGGARPSPGAGRAPPRAGDAPPRNDSGNRFLRRARTPSPTPTTWSPRPISCARRRTRSPIRVRSLIRSSRRRGVRRLPAQPRARPADERLRVRRRRRG